VGVYRALAVRGNARAVTGWPPPRHHRPPTSDAPGAPRTAARRAAYAAPP